MTGLMYRLASFVWSAATRLRLWLRRTPELEGESVHEMLAPGARVIRVGNIQAGGAGKTPLVALIAREAIRRGKCVAIVTRGYQGEWERAGGLLAPASQGPSGNVTPTAGHVGDEAALLRRLVPEAWIVVGKDRVKGVQRLVSEQKVRPDILVIDDGFQSRTLRADVDIVAVTGATPWDRVFRDRFDSLRYATWVIWTKGARLPREIESLNLGRKLLRAHFESTPSLVSAGVWLVSGVGDPDHLEASARRAGYRVERHVRFRDHARYDRSLIEELIRNATEQNVRLVTTGKDAVKWEAAGVSRREFITIEPEVRFETTEQEERLWASLF